MTKVKYHISPETGHPNICRAQVRACPVGGEGDHFPTKAEARAAYEKRMEETTLSQSVKRSEGSSPTAPREATEAAPSLASLPEREHAQWGLPHVDYELTTGEKSLVNRLLEGKAVPPEKLDALLLKTEDWGGPSAFARGEVTQAKKAVKNFLQAARKLDPTPSTTPTVDSFNPATHSLFSNAGARKQSAMAGKALRRAAAHWEWMEGRAQELEAWAQNGENTPEEREAYLNDAAQSRREAQRSQALVCAQIKEVKWLMAHDEDFAKTVDPALRRVLNSFSPVTSLGHMPLASVKKV